jgi:hypothetical protein
VRRVVVRYGLLQGYKLLGLLLCLSLYLLCTPCICAPCICTPCMGGM